MKKKVTLRSRILRSLDEKDRFILSKRSGSAVYKIDKSRTNTFVTITSLRSKRSFDKKDWLTVWLIVKPIK